MAATVLDLLQGRVWAANGAVSGLDIGTRETGWRFVGETPPTQEQFNGAHQLAELASVWLFNRLKAITDEAQEAIANDDEASVIDALKKLFLPLGVDLSVGNGLTKSGTLSDRNLSISLATPSTITASSSNATTPTSHTHAIDKSMLGWQAGDFKWHLGNTAPTGFLVLNGGSYLRATYPDLDAHLAALGYPWGATATTFTLLNMMADSGYFIRANVAGRQVGTVQWDALQNITGSTAGFGALSTSYGVNGALGTTPAAYAPTGGIAGNGTALSFDASRVARTAAETRPRNISMLPCIKY